MVWVSVMADHPVSSSPTGLIIAGLLALLLVGGFILAWRRGRQFTPEMDETDDTS